MEQPIRLKGLTDRLVTESIDFLEARTKDQNPFLLHVSWVHMHTFLDPGRKFAGSTRHGRYGDCVEELDWGTGKILKALDRLGLRDNTLVYFTSDQGGHLEERGMHGEIDGGFNGIYKGKNTPVRENESNPFMPSGLFYYYSLDQSISNSRVSG